MSGLWNRVFKHLVISVVVFKQEALYRGSTWCKTSLSCHAVKNKIKNHAVDNVKNL